jgi:ABC-type nickel/cobalt efflux system permease component RcnA
VAWSVVRVTRHLLDPLRVASAALLSAVGLWMAVIALAMLYLALFRRDAAQVGSDTR